MFLKFTYLFFIMNFQFCFCFKIDDNCWNDPNGKSVSWDFLEKKQFQIDFFVPPNWNFMQSNHKLDTLNIVLNNDTAFVLSHPNSMWPTSEDHIKLNIDHLVFGWNKIFVEFVEASNYSSFSVRDEEGKNWGEAPVQNVSSQGNWTVGVSGLYSVFNCESEFKHYNTLGHCLRFPVGFERRSRKVTIYCKFTNPNNVTFGVISDGKFEEKAASNSSRENETFKIYEFVLKMEENIELPSLNQKMLEVYAFSAGGSFSVRTSSNWNSSVLVTSASDTTAFECYFYMMFAIIASILLLASLIILIIIYTLLQHCAKHNQGADKSEESLYYTKDRTTEEEIDYEMRNEIYAPFDERKMALQNSKKNEDEVNDYEMCNEMYASFEERKMTSQNSRDLKKCSFQIQDLKQEATVSEYYEEEYESLTIPASAPRAPPTAPTAPPPPPPPPAIYCTKLVPSTRL